MNDEKSVLAELTAHEAAMRKRQAVKSNGEVGVYKSKSVKECKKVLFKGPCYLKMLVNNLVAGSIIGKHGKIVSSIEKEVGCMIRLSPSNCFYPKTSERIVVISGKLAEINKAIMIIFEKAKEVAAQYAYDPNIGHRLNRLSCKFVVPRSVVSSIIGKQGQEIKQLQASTKALVRISGREEGLKERIITISGIPKAMQSAALALIKTIQNYPKLSHCMNLVYTKRAAGSGAASGAFDKGGIVNGGNALKNSSKSNSTATKKMQNSNCGVGVLGGGHSGGAPGSQRLGDLLAELDVGSSVPPRFEDDQANCMLSAASGDASSIKAAKGDLPQGHQLVISNMQNCKIMIKVPDVFVGALIGKNGNCLKDIINMTHAMIKISAKNSRIPNTSNRKVTISGAVKAVHCAHIALLHRLCTISSSTN